MASQFYILCKLFGVSIEGMFAARGGCENPGGARIRPLQLRWLREILLVSRPPLLCEEGNAHAQGSSHTDFHELRRSELVAPGPTTRFTHCANPARSRWRRLRS